MLKLLCLIVCLALATTVTGRAGEAGDITAGALYAGDLKGGLARLETFAASDQEAKFGAGLIRFVAVLEGFCAGALPPRLRRARWGPDDGAPARYAGAAQPRP